MLRGSYWSGALDLVQLLLLQPQLDLNLEKQMRNILRVILRKAFCKGREAGVDILHNIVQEGRDFQFK